MQHRARRVDTPIDRISVASFSIPTDGLESDGTLVWDHTTLVVVTAEAGGRRGLGYTYADEAAASVVSDTLASTVEGCDALAVTACWDAMRRAVRNLGRAGIAAMAISAVDAALWDLKARLFGQPLVALLGARRARVAIYGSGGFTSYTIPELQAQLSGWVADGIPRVKMKVGRDPTQDVDRVRAARHAIGADAALFVDANGAYQPTQARSFSERFAALGVSWLEEPVSSDDRAGLRWLRDHVPAGLEIAAGEYGYSPLYFRRMLAARSVDVLQADATRCLGITGFLRAAALADAWGTPLSAHCAPSLHVHVGCAASRLRHLEYFHDHVRIEHMLFDGAPTPLAGALAPDLSRPGMGLELKRADAARYAA